MRLVMALVVAIQVAQIGIGLIGAVWLLVRGEWMLVVGAALMAGIGLGFMAQIILLPGVLMAGGGIALMRSRHPVGASFVMVLAQLYYAAVVSACACLIISTALGEYSIALRVPALMVLFGPSVGIWAALMDRNASPGPTDVVLMFAQLAYLLAAIVAVMAGSSSPHAWQIVYVIVMSVGAAIASVLAVSMMASDAGISTPGGSGDMLSS